MLVTDVYTTVGSFPKPWTCIDILLMLLKRVVICTFMRKHLLSLLFLYELYPYSLICLFMYPNCGLGTFEKQNWFYYKSLNISYYPQIDTTCSQSHYLYPSSSVRVIQNSLPHKNISGAYLQPHWLTFMKCFLANLVKEGLVFFASLFSFRWAHNNK